MDSQIYRKNFKRHIVIVKFVIAKRDIHIERMKISLIQKQILVNLCGILIMIPQVMKSCETKLVLHRVCELSVVRHDVLLIHHLMR